VTREVREAVPDRDQFAELILFNPAAGRRDRDELIDPRAILVELGQIATLAGLSFDEAP